MTEPMPYEPVPMSAERLSEIRERARTDIPTAYDALDLLAEVERTRAALARVTDGSMINRVAAMIIEKEHLELGWEAHLAARHVVSLVRSVVKGQQL